MHETFVRIIGALAASVIGVSPCAAQDRVAEDEPAQALTVDALVAQVLEANAGLAATRAAAQAAAHRVDAAGALDDPSLSYAAAPRSSGRNIEVSQRLPWPGTLAARESAARSEAAAGDRRIDAERLRLAAAAKQAYAEWHFVERALEIHGGVESLVDEMIATAETRYAAGRASRQDVLQAEVERAELAARELELERQRTATAARINALLNRAPRAPLPPAASIPLAGAPALDPDALERLALDGHPELERLGAEIDAADSRVTVARKAFFPEFQLRAGYNTLREDSSKRSTIGVSINVPFARGKRRAELDRARADRRRAEQTLNERRAGVLAAIAAARAEVEENVDAIEVYEQRLVPLAGEYLEAALADYRSGSGSFLSAISAEQRRFETELALERARADYLRRIAELEMLTGAPLAVAPSAPQGEAR